MLRVSSESIGSTVNLETINDGTSTAGIEFESELVAFAEAMVGSEDAALARARTALTAAMGAPAMVDAAGVASNFERMVRIADSTGIPLGAGLEQFSSAVRADLHLERFLENRD